MTADPAVRDAGTIEEQAELLRILGHPLRLAVLRELTGGERAVGAIAERTGLGLSVLSQQLAILRKAALVSARREAKQVFYRIDPARMAQAAALIATLVPAPDHAAEAAAAPVLPIARLGAAMFAQVTRAPSPAR
ncbi:MAG: ArsR/SmtB family transcription factor [Novosphingobium meiothermophilum]|uniref:ArsR/SmtB family transcription factor n=1 Tax=Novosphingobium TaxID=165696 RepID=UPI000D6E05B8|nr:MULTISPECIES: metalloregulator ArsR/SmtB family transcription factor [Novosphingobium]